MTPTLVLTVYKDIAGVYPEGKTRAISAQGLNIIGYETFSLYDNAGGCPPNPDAQYGQFLRLRFPDGDVFVDMTPAEVIAMFEIATAGYALVVDFTVGVDAIAPLDGEDEFVYAPMNGLSVKVYKNGVGWLTDQYELLPGGGIKLLPLGNVFSDDEYYAIYKL